MGWTGVEGVAWIGRGVAEMAKMGMDVPGMGKGVVEMRGLGKCVPDEVLP